MSDISLLQLWLRDMRDDRLQQVPRIVCKSGLAMSVQASRFHYCSPRDDEGPWDKVEIGYPNKWLTELEEYGDGENIFGFVPIELVEKIIEDNGGIGEV